MAAFRRADWMSPSSAESVMFLRMEENVARESSALKRALWFARVCFNVSPAVIL